jgi:hypothetical protein
MVLYYLTRRTHAVDEAHESRSDVSESTVNDFRRGLFLKGNEMHFPHGGWIECSAALC